MFQLNMFTFPLLQKKDAAPQEGWTKPITITTDKSRCKLKRYQSTCNDLSFVIFDNMCNAIRIEINI